MRSSSASCASRAPDLPERRLCKRPATKQMLRLLSFTDRQTLFRNTRPVKVFPDCFSELQLQVLALLGVPVETFAG
jgi:hypothetical protein